MEQTSNQTRLSVHDKLLDKIYKYNYEFVYDYGFYDPIISGSIDGTDDKPHDHGIIRAINSKYKPSRDCLKTDKERTLFIGRLNFKTDEEKLKKYFSKYGKIKMIKIVRDLVTGFSKGYGFIEFKHRSDAKAAHKDSYDLSIDDKKVIVEYEHERVVKGWKPRRLGGGLGGHKQSGQIRFGGRYKPFSRIFNRNKISSYSKTHRR